MRKVCLTISKKGKAKFISHLDLYRALERSLRRALLPIVFTEGYNPHPKLSFLTALELGATSDCEKAIIYLKEPLPLTQIQERLNLFLPDGIKVEDVSFLKNDEISADSSLFLLQIQLPENASKEAFEKAIEEFLSQPSFFIKRETKEKVKEIDLKQFVRKLKLSDFKEGKAMLSALIAITPQGSVKPRELVQALNNFLPGLKLLQVHRKELFLKEVSK
ncbi:DUF2344 domain-containing protein [bacterium]|nr:DUF2344 domain-containing protein [bacterium]